MAGCLRREKYLLGVGVECLLDEQYKFLQYQYPRCLLLYMFVTNLRNRPLTPDNILSLQETILGLYHNLRSGSQTFPFIPFTGRFAYQKIYSPFGVIEPEQVENKAPSHLLKDPPGLAKPFAHSRTPDLDILTPFHPEKATVESLQTDPRNTVLMVNFDGLIFTRVISLVYGPDASQLINRWRVTDYSKGGSTVMSVLTQFTEASLYIENIYISSHRRKDPIDDSSERLIQAKNRLRV